MRSLTVNGCPEMPFEMVQRVKLRARALLLPGCVFFKGLASLAGFGAFKPEPTATRLDEFSSG